MSQESFLSYEEQRVSHEAFIGVMSQSFRGIRDPFVVNLGDIAAEVKRKVVGDIGSGLGGLAKTASVEEIDTAIWSINPVLRDELYNGWQARATREKLPQLYPSVTEEQLVKAQRDHDAHVSTNFAHDLSDFPDGFFDLLIDNYAVHGYMPEDAQALYERTLDEMLRVTKEKILIGDGGGQKSAAWGNPESMQRKAVAARGIEPVIIRQNKSWQKGVIQGVILYKRK